MKFLKKLCSLLLSVVMVVLLGVQPALATDKHEKFEEDEAIVAPVEYQSVANKISETQKETVIQQGTENIHYYWGTDFFVVGDGNGYYIVNIIDDFTQFTVNGMTFDITVNESVVNTAAITYPTPWTIAVDTNNSFDVGGLPHSVVGGLIGAAVGSQIPSAGLSTIVGTVLGSLAGMFIGGVFPVDYKLTVKFQKMIRILEPGNPTIIEHHDRVAIYGGPSNNLYATTFCYDTNTYTREAWE